MHLSQTVGELFFLIGEVFVQKLLGREGVTANPDKGLSVEQLALVTHLDQGFAQGQMH